MFPKAYSLTVVLATLGLRVYAQEGAAPACVGEFAPSADTCAKFGFTKNYASRPCINPEQGQSTFYNLDELPQVENLDENTIRMASLITNVFEYGDPAFAYAACQDIGDMRGFTCGYVGFTTGTNDASQLIELYTQQKPDNALAPHLERLREISATDSCDQKSRSSTQGLETFCDAWRNEACHHDAFAQLQRRWTHEHYMIPSARFAAAAGISSPLGQAIFYDTLIQHGYQFVEPDINLVRLMLLTGDRKANESEASYLTRFLTTRRQMQCCYPDHVWPASATRSADLQRLVDEFDANQSLRTPVRLVFFNQVVDGTESGWLDQKRCPA